MVNEKHKVVKSLKVWIRILEDRLSSGVCWKSYRSGE